MRRMWQKYTPGKRVLALFLAIIMMLDPFTVSAATTEGGSQGVEPEVVVEEVVTTESTETTEEDLVEEEISTEVETTEVETEIETEVESTEVETEIETEVESTEVEIENEEIEVVEEEVTAQMTGTLSDTAIVLTDYNWNYVYYPNVVNYFIGNNLYSNTVNLCVRFDPNEVDTSLEPVVTVESDGGWFTVGQEVAMYGYNTDEDGYVYYNRTLSGGGTEWPYAEFEYGVLTVTVGDVTRKFTLARGDLQYTINNAETGYFRSTSVAEFEVGDVLSLASNNHASGAFGYMTFSEGNIITASGITDAEAKSAWDANYAATYGEYGAEGKYYCFTYGTDNSKTWLPVLSIVKEGSETICYSSLNTVGSMQSIGYTVNVFPNYTVQYEGTEMIISDDGMNNVPYTKGDLRFYVYKDGVKANATDATVSICGWDGTIEDALSAKTDENNCWYIEIDDEKVRDYEDNVVGLAKSPDAKHFSISIEDKALASTKRFSYVIASVEMQIQKESGNELFSESDTVEVDFSEQWIGLALPVDHGDTRYVNPKITYSDSSVLELHAYEGGYSYGSFAIRAKKLGTTKVTISYTIDGVKETYTANIKLVSNKELEFGIWDMNDYILIPFADDKMTAEIGTTYSFFTNVSPMLLSNITVTSADPSIFSVWGGIAESTFEQNGETYTTRSYAQGQPQNLGETTLTFSAKYNGETVTQIVKVTVKEATGLSVKNVYVDNWNDEVYSIGNKVTNVGIDNSNRDILYAICDDVVVGTDESGNPIYENTYADKDNYDIVIVDRWTNEPSEYLSVKFIDESIFYIVPNEENVTSSVYNQILRVTSKADNTKKTEVQLNYNKRALIYESYTDGKLSGLTDSISVVEGVGKSVYLEVGAGYTAADLKNLKVSNIEYYGVTVKTKIVESSETRTVVELTFDYKSDGNNVGWSYTYINTGTYDNSTEAYIYPMAAAPKEVPGFSQQAVSDFYHAADASKDIPGGMRFGDCEYAFRTIDGKKVAIVVGYLGNENHAFIEKDICMPIIVSKGDTYISVVQTMIPIIGVEDGAFDTRNGYVEAEVISLFAGHNYFGEKQSGLVNPNGGRVRFDWWQGEATFEGEKIFETYDGMLFVKQEDGSYKCIETGNASVAPVVLNSLTLYTNSPMPYDVVELKKSSNVADYKLASNYLLTEDGTATVLRVAIENGSYVVSTDSGATVTSGTYYLALTPQKWVYAIGGLVDLPTIKVKVVVNAKNETPAVTMNNEVTMNKYLKTDAIVLLNEQNSFGTVTTVAFTPESAEKATELGLTLVKNGDQKTLLYWDGQTTLPTGKLVFDVQFEVAGFTATETMSIPNQKLTVNVIDKQPQTTVSANKVTFKEFPYEPALLEFGITNGFVNNNVKNLAVKAVSAPKGVDLEDATASITFAPDSWNYNTVLVFVHNNTEPGTYQFEIAAELYTEKAQYFAIPVKVTVEVKGSKPALQFNGKVNVTLDATRYNTDVELPSISLKSEPNYLSVYDGSSIAVKSEMISKPKTATDGAVVVRAIYREPLPENGDWLYYEVDDLKLIADVAKDAPAGTYKLNVAVPLYVNGDVVYSKIAVSVKVVNKIPTFKLSSSTATLDCSHVGSGSGVTLALEPGYVLVSAVYKPPTVEAAQCIRVDTNSEGGIHFTLERAGITKAGTYKITPTVMTPSGEVIKLKDISINVKLTNSDKSTLAVKTKTININPYAGNVVVDPVFTTKNETAEGAVSYEVLPTSEASMKAGMQLVVDADGKLHVTNCEDVANGKYTYNVVKCVGGVYTKPVAITLNVAKKALTIKPANAKITLYSACSNGFTDEESGMNYIFAQIPVEIVGAESLNLMDYLAVDENGLNATNNLSSDWSILTFFEQDVVTGEASLIVATPYIYNGNITITPNIKEGVSKEFASIKITLNVKNGVDNKGNLILPTVKFENSKLTLNRFATDNVTNTIPDAEANFIFGMNVTSITLKGKKDNVRDSYFTIDNATDRNSINIKIKPECIDTIPNGTYVVTAVPTLAYVWGDELAYGDLAPCSFELKVEDTKATISVSEKAVNLYPEIGGANVATVAVSAKAGDAVLTLDKVEVKTTGKAAVTTAESNNTVTFTADVDAAKGANKYDVTVYAKRYGGQESLAIGTAKNAVTANVKLLPAALKLSSTKLKFNPYLQPYVSMTVADKEIKAKIESGEYRFTISSPVETDSTYKKLVPQLNDVLVLETTSDGTIIVNAKSLPKAKATYYYSCVYTLHNLDGTGGYKNYEVKFSVAVETTQPTVQLSAKSVTLDNAYLTKTATTNMSLKTGADVWDFVEVNDNYRIIDSKKNDVTDKFTVSIIDGRINVGLKAFDEAGKVVTVAKGNYTLEVTPKVTTDIVNEPKELALVKVTVKVNSSRPAYVKGSVSLTANTWTNGIASAQVTLKSGEGFAENEQNRTQIKCTKAPTGANESLVHVGFTTDGTLTAWADREAKAGNYSYEITPYISRDGFLLELSPLKVTVKVDTKQPSVVVSDKALATVNTNFAGFYSKDLTISLAGASNCAFGFTKADIATTETNATRKANANKLLEAMAFTTNADGSITLNVNLNGDAASVPTGTYKYVIKNVNVKSGNYMTEADEAYKLGDIKFSVKVENTKAKVTAKATGSIDLLKRGTTDVDIQLSFNKQNYETLDNIVAVRLLESGRDYDSRMFYVSDDTELSSGKFSVKAYGWADIAAKNQAVTVEVTTISGNVYTVKATLKVTQSNVKITAAKTAIYYAEADIAEIPITISDENVGISYVNLAAVKMGNKKLNVADFSCDIGFSEGMMIQLQSDEDLSEYVGKTLTCTFEIAPAGMASNKQPTKVNVNIVIK